MRRNLLDVLVGLSLQTGVRGSSGIVLAQDIRDRVGIDGLGPSQEFVGVGHSTLGLRVKPSFGELSSQGWPTFVNHDAPPIPCQRIRRSRP